MIKKIAVSVMCIIMTFQISCLNPAVESKEEEIQTVLSDSNQEAILRFLDIKKENSGALNQEITRGEFADMLAPIVVYTGHEMGEDYTDVSESHQYFEAIEQVIGGGVMHGISASEFAPDSPIKYEHARMAVLRMLSVGQYASVFEQSEAYYNQFEQAIGLKRRQADGVNMTRHMAYDLIYDALFTKMLEVNFTGLNAVIEKSDEYFLTSQLDIVFVRGQLVDNGITSLTGKSKVNADQIMLGDTEMYYEDASVISYLGYELECYVRVTDDETTLVCYSLSDRTQKVEIQDDDIVSVEENSIVYEENNREKTLNISENIDVIYNGKYDATYTNKEFENICGNVTFIRNSGDNRYSVAIVHDRDTYVVSRVTTSKLYLTSDAEEKLYLDPDEQDIDIYYYYNGEVSDFSQITADSVLGIEKSRDEKLYTVHISNTEVTGVVNGMDAEGVTIEGVYYKYSKYFLEKTESLDYVMPKIGVNNLIYLDCDGKVAKVNAQVLRDAYGWIERIYKGDDDENIYVKLYSENGTLEIYTLKEKVNFNEIRMKANTILTNADFMEEGSTIRQLVTYKANENNEISMLNTAKDMTGVAGYEGYDPDHFTLDGYTERSAYRAGTWSSFDAIGNARISNSTVVFMIPSLSGRDVSEFAIETGRYFEQNSTYDNVYIYNTQENRVADVVVLYNDFEIYEGEYSICVFDSITMGLDEDDMPTYVLHAYDRNGAFTINTEGEDVCDESGYYWPSDSSLPENKYAGVKLQDLPRGAIIQYTTNAYNKISNIRILQIDGLAPYETWTMTRGGENNSTIRSTMMYKTNKNFYQFVKTKKMISGVLLYEMNNEIYNMGVSATKNITIVEDNKIRTGLADEIEPGDRLFITSSWQNLGMIVCYKQ